MALISTNAYGDLDLQGWAWVWPVSDGVYGYTFQTDKGYYTFIPDDFISKGYVSNGKQYYSSAFTNKDNLTQLYTKYQPIDFGGFKDFSGADAFYERLKASGFGTSGVLVPEDWTVNNIYSTNSIKSYTIGMQVGIVTVGAIQGLGEKDGQMVYVPSSSGGSQSSAYISGNTTYTIGVPTLNWYQKLAQNIAQIPLFPEIAAITTAALGGANYAPYVYAALKGAALGAQGVDPLKAGLMVGINLAAQNLATNTDFAKSIGASFGATTSASQIAIGKAVIGASVNGIKAASTGGDVADAMVSGALTSGADTTIAAISKNALGSNYQSIINDIATNTNLTNVQIQSVIASSVVSGITAEIKGGNFAEAFGNGLVSGGISTSLANQIGSTVEGNVTPEMRSAIVTGTAAVTRIATNAMLNGQDVGAALEANLPSTIYSTMAAYAEEKDKQAKNAAAVKAGWSDYGQQSLAESKYGAGITPDQYAFNEAKATQQVAQETTQQETQPEGIATLPTGQTTTEEPVQVAEETVKPVEEETLTDLTQLVTAPETTEPAKTEEEVVPVSSTEGTATLESQLTPGTTDQTATITEPSLTDLVKDVVEVPETIKPVAIETFEPLTLEPTVVSPRIEDITAEAIATETGVEEPDITDLINREENIPYGYFVDFDGEVKPISELLSTTDRSLFEKPEETTEEPEKKKQVKVDTLGNVYDSDGNFIGYAADFGMKMTTDPLSGNVAWETEEGNVIKASPFGPELATPGPAAGSVLPEKPFEFSGIGDQEGDYPMQIINNPDGSVTSVEADGSTYTFNADGSITYTDPDGNSSIVGGATEQPQDTTSSYDFKLSNLADSLLGPSFGTSGISNIDYDIPFVPMIAGGAALGLLGDSGQESYNPYAYDPMGFAWNPLAVQAPIDGVARGQQFFEPTYITAAGGGLMSIQPVQYIQPTVPSEMITNTMTVKQDPTSSVQMYNQGGISTLGSYSDGGRMLKGPGDGMSDDIPATIAGRQPARLANEEFVIPADVVSHLGNGSSEAGAKVLYKMMAEVRKARTGKTKQARQINPERYMPRG